MIRSPYIGLVLVITTIGAGSVAVVADSPGLMILVWMVLGTTLLFGSLLN